MAILYEESLNYPFQYRMGGRPMHWTYSADQLPEGWQGLSRDDLDRLTGYIRGHRDRWNFLGLKGTSDAEADSWLSEIAGYIRTAGERERAGEMRAEQADLRRTFREQSKEDRAYWQRMRDKAMSDWEKDKARVLSMLGDPAYKKESERRQDFLRGSLSRWENIFEAQKDFLTGIRDQQVGLARELRDAPSTVAEQARIESERALEESVAMAGAFGGSLATDYSSFRDRAENRRGDVLRDTSALRAEEYLNRIGQRAGLLGQAGGTSVNISNLGITDANLRNTIGDRLYRESVLDRSQNLQTALGLAQGNYEVATGLGLSNLGVGSTLLGREATLHGLFGNVLDREGMADRLGYDRFERERAYRALLSNQAHARASGTRSIIGRLGGKILGSLFGGPVGGAVGGEVGSAVLGGSGSLRGGDFPEYLNNLRYGSSDRFPLLPFEMGQYNYAPMMQDQGGGGAINQRYFDQRWRFSRHPRDQDRFSIGEPTFRAR